MGKLPVRGSNCFSRDTAEGSESGTFGKLEVVNVAGDFHERDVNLGEKLCLECGLCCDGTLFDNVRLLSEDAPERMKEAGLPVRMSRAKNPVVYMRQPCAALCADRTCRIYQNRPTMCRRFECRVYKETLAGRMSFAKALKLIRQAQRLGNAASRCMKKLGPDDTTRSLHDRFRAMQKHVDQLGEVEGAGEYFSKLALLMHRLQLLAHKHFFTRPE